MLLRAMGVSVVLELGPGLRWDIPG